MSTQIDLSNQYDVQKNLDKTTQTTFTFGSESDESSTVLSILFGAGATGDCGIRNSSGTMQYKNLSGTWSDIGSGGTVSIQPFQADYTAGENISLYKLVYIKNDGLIYIANNTSLIQCEQYIGIAITAGNTGETITVLKKGIVTNSSWSLNINNRIFLGTSGNVTQTEPLSANILQIGHPVAVNAIYIEKIELFRQWITSNRPTSGYKTIGYNVTNAQMEFYDGTSWHAIA